MSTRLANPGPVQQPGVTGAALFNNLVGAGIAFGTQPPTGGGFGLNAAIGGASSVASMSVQGALTMGGDDYITSTNNGQGGGSGRNTSIDCMSATEHTASVGNNRGPAPGAPAFCGGCVWNGFMWIFMGR